jgi:hypothetical protein
MAHYQVGYALQEREERDEKKEQSAPESTKTKLQG